MIGKAVVALVAANAALWVGWCVVAWWEARRRRAPEVGGRVMRARMVAGSIEGPRR